MTRIAGFIGFCGVLLAAVTALCLIFYMARTWGIIKPGCMGSLRWMLVPLSAALTSRVIILAYIAFAHSYRAGGSIFDFEGFWALDSGGSGLNGPYTMLLCNLSFAAACAASYRAQLLRSGTSAALWTVILICASPYTFFLSLPRLSNLAFLFWALSYLMMIEKRRMWAAICFIACAAADPRYAWLLPVLLLERGWLKKLLCSDIGFALALVVACLRGLWPPSNLFAASYSTTTMFSIFIPLMVMAFISLALCALMVRRVRPAPLAGTALEGLMPLLTGLLVPMPAFSMPLVISGARDGERRVYLLLSLTALAYLAAQWAFFAPLLPGVEALP